QEMEKLPIGPCAGSCGTAAYRGSAVIVSDIATDPLWEVPEHRAAALSHGLRASWSNPIMSSEGKVLGTFCIYERETRRPSAHDLELIEKAAYLARVAIERDRAEADLRTSEEKYRDLINASPDAVCVLDADSKWVLVNPAGIKLTGRLEEELIGSSVSDTYVPEELHLFRDRIEKLKAEGSFRFERKFLRKNGEVIPVEVSLAALRGRYYQAIIRDISQRKRREALLAGENRVLEMVAKGDSLAEILDKLCVLVEEQSSGVLASILLMDRNVCHVLSRATQPEPARAGDNQAHYISRGRGHSTQAGGKGPPRERSLSGGSTTPQPYRELGMDTCFRRNQVLVRGNLSRAWF